MSEDSGQQYDHATAVLLGSAGVLIRGPSGSGKSSLAQALLNAAGERRHLAALVGDDRVLLTPGSAGLIASGAPALAGMIELRGRGIETAVREPQALIRLVIDLVPAMELERMPDEAALTTVVQGERIARQPVPVGDILHQLALVRAALKAVCGEAGCPV